MPSGPNPNDLFRLFEQFGDIKVQSGSRGEVESLRDLVAKQKVALETQNTLLKQLAEPPYIKGTIVSLQKYDKGLFATIAAQGQVAEMLLPDLLAPKAKVGLGVRINSKMGTLVDIIEEGHMPTGFVTTVARILDATSLEIDVNGSVRIVNYSDSAVKTGDRIMVNDGMSVVLKILAKPIDTYSIKDAEAVNVPWDSIGGQKHAKVELQEAIEGPIKHANIFKAYGKKAVKGIMLYGPPGCGKTLLAKAAATSLANLHGKPASTGFIYVKGPEILNKWVGESEATIRDLFQRARDHKKKHGYPAVLFIDEADAILTARGSDHRGMEKTIVPMFLAEMDGMDQDGPLVLLATNRSDQLDPAIVRDGRVDRKIEVTRPLPEDALEIFRMYLKGKPIADKELDLAAYFTANLYMRPALQNRVCGALIAGAVDQAVSSALRRDLAAGQDATGLTFADIDTALTAVENQNKDVR